MGICKNCNGHLYGCQYEDDDISFCDDKDMTNRMTQLAYNEGFKNGYKQGKSDAIKEVLKVYEDMDDVMCTEENCPHTWDDYNCVQCVVDRIKEKEDGY